MADLFHTLLDAKSFIPHGHCYLWKPSLVGLHLISDAVIALAYYSIPVVLIDFVRRRQDLPFRWIFWLFGAFIVFCGTTHLMEVWTLWYPAYWISGVLKAVTAIISLATAILLVPLVPQAVALPSPAQLEAANQELQREIIERKKAEAALQKIRDELELRVAERTGELVSTYDELKASEEKFRQLAENIREFFFIQTFDSRQMLYVSPGYERIWGRSRDSLYQNPVSWLEAVHPDDRDSVLRGLQQHTEGKPFRQEYRVIQPNGAVRWVFRRTSIICNTAGEPYRIVGLAEDITDRKQAEAERLQAEKLRLELTLLENILDIILAGYWDWDIPNNREYLSPGFKRMFGYDDDALPNSPETWQSLIFADDLPGALECFDRHAQSHGEIPYYNEVRYRHQDGSTVWVICSGQVIEWDEVGNPMRMIGCHIDITDRKRAEQRLELQDIIVKNMAEGICLVNSNGIIVYANPKFEQMFGYDPEELVGWEVAVLNYNDETVNAEAVTQEILSTIDTCGAYSYEVLNVKKNGTPFWCRATTSKFDHPEHGTVYVAVQADISALKQAEAQARISLQIKATLQEKEASLQEKEVLLQEIHHRVKNNLQIIDGLLQMQSRRTENPQAAAILLESQHRIKSIALVHEKLYRSDDLANLDFSDYISSLISNLVDSYQVSSTTVIFLLQIDDIALDIDTAIPCGLIVNELVSNALKYAFPGDRKGEVRLTLCASEPNWLTLLVHDNGVGIPSNINLQKTQSLGLKLVRGLAAQLEGTVEIDRTQGTLVRITFPTSKSSSVPW